MNIRFCIPFYHEFEWARQSAQQIEHSKLHKFDIVARHGTVIHEIRNSFITDGTDDILQYDAWLFQDSDIKSTPEDIYKLIDYDLPIVSGVYQRHNAPNITYAGEWDGHNCGQNYVWENTGLKKVGYTGAGFLFVKREVFENIKPDWFRLLEIKTDKRIYSMSEDYSFCKLSQNAGYDVHVDFDVKVKHRLRNQESNFDDEIIKSIQQF